MARRRSPAFAGHAVFQSLRHDPTASAYWHRQAKPALARCIGNPQSEWPLRFYVATAFVHPSPGAGVFLCLSGGWVLPPAASSSQYPSPGCFYALSGGRVLPQLGVSMAADLRGRGLLRATSRNAFTTSARWSCQGTDRRSDLRASNPRDMTLHLVARTYDASALTIDHTRLLGKA